MSPDCLCKWQVYVSVYYACRIPAHLRCTQCSILLHLMDICFLPCISLLPILQIQTCLCVFVGPGFVSTSPAGTRSFIYADDLCVTAQYPTFQEVEQQIEEALGELTHYYRSNSLRANPDKTQVIAFHLRNREAKRSLHVWTWRTLIPQST